MSEEIQNPAFLLTGSNTGNRLKHLSSAKAEISTRIGEIVLSSHIYESKSWGYLSENMFYNQALLVRTILTPHEMLNILMEIEKNAGRIRKGGKYQDRTLDIDILLIGDTIIDNEKLKVPHPLLHLRRFALIPMEEIAPDFLHPVFKKSIRDILMACPDRSESRKLSQLS